MNTEPKPRLASVKVTAPEDEIKAIGELITIFLTLDKEAADRVLTYLRARFVKSAR